MLYMFLFVEPQPQKASPALPLASRKVDMMDLIVKRHSGLPKAQAFAFFGDPLVVCCLYGFCMVFVILVSFYSTLI